jgi:hypothetical protein
MSKVLEDILARDIADNLDFFWDGSRITIDHTTDIDNHYVKVSGVIDYQYYHEDDTDSTYMTWVDVTIDEIIVEHYDDDDPSPTPHFNEAFVEKYLEQYLLTL